MHNYIQYRYSFSFSFQEMNIKENPKSHIKCLPLISCWYHIDIWLLHWPESESKGVIALILGRTFVDKHFSYRILIQVVSNITALLKLNANVYFHLLVICHLKSDCPQNRKPLRIPKKRKNVSSLVSLPWIMEYI